MMCGFAVDIVSNIAKSFGIGGKSAAEKRAQQQQAALAAETAAAQKKQKLKAGQRKAVSTIQTSGQGLFGEASLGQ